MLRAGMEFFYSIKKVFAILAVDEYSNNDSSTVCVGCHGGATCLRLLAGAGLCIAGE